MSINVVARELLQDFTNVQPKRTPLFYFLARSRVLLENAARPTHDSVYQCCAEFWPGEFVNTKKIGLFKNISFEEYCAIDAVNNSSLNDFDRSPAYYYAKHLAPDREQQEPTPSMLLGTAIHTAVLEFPRFIETYSVKPQIENFPGCLDSADQYKAKAKELGLKVSGTKPELKKSSLEVAPDTKFFDDIERQFENKYKLLKKDDYESCIAICNRIKKSPTASTLFADGFPEITMLWIDANTGLYCKARIDYISGVKINEEGQFEIVGPVYIVDLKSTEDARPREFARSIANYGYHRQAGHYTNGLISLGIKGALFVFAAYERSAPYAASFTYASDAMLSQSREELSNLLNRLKACKSAEQWPAYDETLVPIDLPAWRSTAKKELETF